MGELRSISISTSFNYDIPLGEQLPMISEAGFSHVSLGGQEAHSSYLSEQGRRKIKELLAECGLSIDTIHGPRIDRQTGLDDIGDVVEAAVALSVKTIVVHCSPFSFNTSEFASRFEALTAKCDDLAKMARDSGVRFALENVLPGPATELVRRCVLSTDPACFGFCYDSSHDQVGGPNAFTLLDELGDRLVALHLSDRVRDFVDHVIPGEGFIDWPDLCGHIRESGFNGPLLLEVMMTHSSEKDPGRFLSKAYEAGCLLYDRIFRQGACHMGLA